MFEKMYFSPMYHLKRRKRFSSLEKKIYIRFWIVYYLVVLLLLCMTLINPNFFNLKYIVVDMSLSGQIIFFKNSGPKILTLLNDYYRYNY